MKDEASQLPADILDLVNGVITAQQSTRDWLKLLRECDTEEHAAHAFGQVQHFLGIAQEGARKARVCIRVAQMPQIAMVEPPAPQTRRLEDTQGLELFEHRATPVRPRDARLLQANDHTLDLEGTADA